MEKLTYSYSGDIKVFKLKASSNTTELYSMYLKYVSISPRRKMTKVSDPTGDLVSREQIFHVARLLGNLSMAMVGGINCIGK